MDEQQLRPYLELIEALRNCSQEDKSKVYQQFAPLIDNTLVEIMTRTADWLESQGDSNANWLRQEAANLSAALSSWKQLYQQVIELYGSGNIARAIPYAEQALTVARNIFPSPNNDLAGSLNNLALLYQAQGRWSEAEPLYIEALRIYRELFGETANNYLANCLNGLALLYQAQGRWSEAEPLYLDALKIRRELFGETANNDLAGSLNNLAFLYETQGRWSEAEPLYKEALRIRRELFGETANNDLATSLNNLAGLYQVQGRWSEAEPLHKEALKIHRELFGETAHNDLANSLNNLAGLYQAQGRWSEAEPLYLESLRIRQELFGQTANNDLASSLNNLALLYQAQGRWSEAEPLYQEALRICRELFGQTANNDLASSLNNLALLYQAQGRWSEAEPLYKESLRIRQELFGETSNNDLAISLNNLANLYQEEGRWSEAEPLYLDALKIRRELFGETANNDLAISLNNLAGLYQLQGRWSEAEPLYKESLRIRRELFGQTANNDLASSLNNLAFLYQLQGRWSEAEPLYIEALRIFRELFGQTANNDLASTLNNLALLYAATNRYREALNLFIEAIQVQNSILADYFTYATPDNQLILLEKMQSSLDGLVSLVWRYLKDSPKAVEAALNAILKRKAASTISSTLLNRAQYNERYPQLTAKFTRWQDLKTRIALQGERLDTTTLKALQQECEQLREQLARQVPEIKAESLDIDRQALALYLPPNAQLVEFLRFNVFNFQHSTPEDKNWLAPRYIAFILSHNTDAPLELIDLGEAEPIDNLIQRYRSIVASGFLSNMAMDDEPRPESTLEIQVGHQLQLTILQPILERLPNNTTTLVLAADGDLYLVPFASLPLNTFGQRLLDSYQIETLTAARDLRRRHETINRPAADPLIVADPDYDYGSPQENEPELVQAIQQCSSSLGGKFNRLAMTGELATQIAQKLQITPHLDAAATEPLFHQRQSPRNLVIATHGFATDAYSRLQYAAIDELNHCPIELEEKVLEKYQNVIDQEFCNYWEQVLNNLQTQNSHLIEWCQNLLNQIKGRLNTLRDGSLTQRLKQENDPMRRSGIALTGANCWLQMNPLPEEIGKGVLLAQDIAQLNLWGTELALIVACSTGLGDVKSGQGVFGLRRALAIAGAKHAIVSLWDVPAYASMLLMDYFYTSYLSGTPPDQALRDAQNDIRSITVGELKTSPLGEKILAELQLIGQINPQTVDSQQPLGSPYYWAAWISQG